LHRSVCGTQLHAGEHQCNSLTGLLGLIDNTFTVSLHLERWTEEILLDG
jgi:hypothetical protein